MDESEIEPFEAPKILGDVFESVIGAIFVDGGLNAVMRVYKHLVSPLILYIAKFSKEACKEPKETFVIRAATEFRIKPKFFLHEQASVKEVSSKELVITEYSQESHRLLTEASMYQCDVLYRKG